MSPSRDIRRCAIQELYQLDAGGDGGDLTGSLGAEGEARADDAVRQEGAALAAKAWASRHDADQDIARFTPEWPIHRQPIVDRNVLRLAWWEMVHGGVPAALAISEAVDLAREFGGERSPPFVNAVLDRIRRERGVPSGGGV
ncbi:MAG: transcription antitermination factor NusB [Phycisphaeraceae bacterium]|nr:transcription antitermination factor NusB [Phycisphaeraceae bacterium]